MSAHTHSASNLDASHAPLPQRHSKCKAAADVSLWAYAVLSVEALEGGKQMGSRPRLTASQPRLTASRPLQP
jgi:hypothetical protein